MARKLNAPENLKAKGTDETCAASWQSVDGADGYRLFFYSADDPNLCIKTRYAQGGAGRSCRKRVSGFVNGREYLLSVCGLRRENGREISGEHTEKIPFVPICDRLKAQETLSLGIGETAQLEWEYMGRRPRVSFTSDNSKIASVSEGGLVTAKSSGTAYIKITSDDGQTFRTKAAVARSYEHGNARAVMMFTGDIVCSAAQQKAAETEMFDFCDAFSVIKDTLAKADCTVGVLEGGCLDSMPFRYEQPQLAGGIPNSNTPSTFLSAVSLAGFDALVTATNQSLDLGQSGLEKTVGGIKRFGMRNIGTFGDNPVIVEVRGIKVAILAVTMIANSPAANFHGVAGGCVNILGRYDRDYFLELLNKARSMGAEYIVAYQHWGRVNALSVRKSQREEAQFMADSGADLIIGSHPHVLQRFEYIAASNGRKVPCAYSLGNFLCASSERCENRDGAILRAELVRTRGGISASLSYIPTFSLTGAHGAAVVPVYPVFSEESRASLERTKKQLGRAISCIGTRPKVLLSGSANLVRIFCAGNGFRLDKTPLLLSQISLGSAKVSEPDENEDAKLVLDIGKNLKDYVWQTNPDYIAVDFSRAATASCYKAANDLGAEPSFYTNTRLFRSSDFFRRNRASLVHIRPPFGESVWKPAVERYARIVAASFPRGRIILFRTKLPSRRSLGHELRTSAEQDKTNRIIRAMEDCFIRIANPLVVELSDKYLGDNDRPWGFEESYYIDAYRAAEKLTADSGRTCISVPDAQLWFERAMMYYDNMTARSCQGWLLDMDCAADKLVAYTSAEFAARNSSRIIKLKRMGMMELPFVKDFFADDPNAAELVRAAEIIHELLSGNLDKPYDFFEPAFRGKFNILRTMVRLLSAEVGASVNESSTELVFLLRGKTQMKRYISALSRVTVDIWGSDVSRESINRSSVAYIGKYIVNQAQILAFEPPIEVDFPESAEMFRNSRWRRRTLKNAFEKSGLGDIESTKSQWILVDFYDIICRMAEYKGGLFEIDDFVCRTDFYNSIKENCTECYLFEKRDMRYCFEAISKFAGRISEMYGNHIILIKTEPKASYITIDDRLMPFDDDGMLEIKKKFMSLCEERFAGITGCYIIDISKHFYASDKFPLGGADIVHYEDEFYRQAGEYISAILRGSEQRVFSTADDNYTLLRTLRLNRER